MPAQYPQFKKSHKTLTTSNYWWLAAAWLSYLAIVVLSLVPGEHRPHTVAPGYVEHFFAYLFVAIFFGLGLGSPKKGVLAATAMAAASGLFELLQMWVPGRSPEFIGFLSSSLGAFAGISLVMVTTHSYSPDSQLLTFLKARRVWIIAGCVCFVGMAIAALVPGSLVIRSGLGAVYDHFIGYAVVALTFGLATRTLRSAMLIAVGMTAMAILFETAQHFIPGRNFNLIGFQWSSAGAWAGFAAAITIRWIYRQLARRNWLPVPVTSDEER